MTDPASSSPKKAPIWQRHRGLAIAAAVFVVLLITVLSDLPVSTSRADDITAERSVMTEVNTDLGPCALAVHQAIGIWNLQAAHTLTAADRAPTPGLLSDDQTACSFTSENIFDLSDIEVPGTPAGKDLGQMIATATLWTTSDSLRAIEDVQTLMSDPTDASALRSLADEDKRLATDRSTALSQEKAADRALATRLPSVDLPRRRRRPRRLRVRSPRARRSRTPSAACHGGARRAPAPGVRASGSSSLWSHRYAFQKITGMKAAAAANHSTAEAIC